MDAKVVVRQAYAHADVEVAAEWATEIVRDLADESTPGEVRRLGRTLSLIHI